MTLSILSSLMCQFLWAKQYNLIRLHFHLFWSLWLIRHWIKGRYLVYSHVIVHTRVSCASSLGPSSTTSSDCIFFILEPMVDLPLEQGQVPRNILHVYIWQMRTLPSRFLFYMFMYSFNIVDVYAGLHIFECYAVVHGLVFVYKTKYSATFG